MKSDTYKILQMDGGGLKGIIFLKFLADLEQKLGQSVSKYFDMFIGTSTGGISAAAFACGMSAVDALEIYLEHGGRIFNKRFLGAANPGSWWSGRYKRRYVDGLMDKYFKVKMKNLKKDLIVTAVNMKDDQYTHFFKSSKAKYRNHYVSELTKRTYSAPTFFGYYKDKEGLWSDGGVGVHNSTLLEAYIETIRNKIKNYYILSCGTGDAGCKSGTRFILKQIKDFIPIARRQAIQMQANVAQELKVNCDRVNIGIPPKIDKMDKIKYAQQYLQHGSLMGLKYIPKLKIRGDYGS